MGLIDAGTFSREREDSVAPLVSIGLPTYNGERFISLAMECLLGQDYPNLEIVVSDNCSTDRTAEIVSEFAAQDARIRLVRQATNIGAAANFNAVFRETSGPLFMWAGDDDRWDRSYVRSCVEALQVHPDAVLACSGVTFIGDDIDPEYERDFRNFDNPDLSEGGVGVRLRMLMSRRGWYLIYGVIRRDTLRETRLFTETFGADVVLLIELAMLGPFARVDGSLFQYRVYRTRMPSRGPWDGVPADVQHAPYSHLQEHCSAAIWVSNARRLDKLRAWLGLLEATYLRATPMRRWVRAETKTRLAAARRQRNLKGIAKFGLLRVAHVTGNQLCRIARRWAS